MRTVVLLLALTVASGCGRNGDDLAEGVPPGERPMDVRGVVPPARPSDNNLPASSSGVAETESESAIGSAELQMLKTLSEHLGKGFGEVNAALGPPDKTEGSNKLHAYRTYWMWLPSSSLTVKQGIKQGGQHKRDGSIFVVAEFNQKKELSAFGATWPLFDAENLVKKDGWMVPAVRQSYPSVQQTMDHLGIGEVREPVILEGDVQQSAVEGQKPTELWISRNGLRFAPLRALFVIQKGDTEFHVRCYVNEGAVISRVERLNESSGQLETVETASMSRSALLASPICSVMIAKKGHRIEYPLLPPGIRLAPAPLDQIPPTRAGNLRSVRVKLSQD